MADLRFRFFGCVPLDCNNEVTTESQSFGEKSVSLRKVESTFWTSLPLASLAVLTCIHSGSLWNAAQFAVAASRFGC